MQPHSGCGNQYPIVPGTNPALQTWNGQAFVVADGSAQNPISLPFLKTTQGEATYFLGADNNGNLSYYNPTNSSATNNINGGTAGVVVYQTGVNATGFTAAGTSGQVLLSNGTSSPTWSTNIAGNSGTATQLQTSRTLGISGDVTGTASFDGSANATIAGTIANGVVTAAKLGANERKQICKAWVNFNGTTASPSTIRSSYNVSSITKNSTGDYTVNFATALEDANYTAVVMAQGTSTANLVAPVAYAGTNTGGAQFVTPLATSVRFSTWTSSLTGQADSAIINVQVFGN